VQFKSAAIRFFLQLPPKHAAMDANKIQQFVVEAGVVSRLTLPDVAVAA
jgi:hypothetical protein